MPSARGRPREGLELRAAGPWGDREPGETEGREGRGPAEAAGPGASR